MEQVMIGQLNTQPLLVVSGASCAGKSMVYQALLGKINEVVMLEGDLIWRSEFDTPETKYRNFCETWLMICRDISQSGRPAVMFNAGLGVPENIEPCAGRQHFSRVHYLALICEDDVLADRLRQRSESHNYIDSEYIDKQIEFNQWLKNEGPKVEPPIQLIDTTGVEVEQTAKQVASWIRGRVHENADQPNALRVSVSELRKKLGPKFSARIMALYTALNKVNAQMDFLLINYWVVLNQESARWQRNFKMALMISFGVLYELYERISDIMKGPMKIIKENSDLADYVNNILALFNGEEYISLLEAYRNQMSFHIDICNVKFGLELKEEDTVDFLLFDSTKEKDTFYKFPDDALFVGFVKRNESKFAKLVDSENPPPVLSEEMRNQALEKLVKYISNVHVNIGPAIGDLFNFLIDKYNLKADVRDSK